MDHLNYSLRLQIHAHTNDVRTLCVVGDTIVSGSRDMSVKVWKENRGQYENSGTHKAHTNYISSVCVLPESRNFPSGLIMSGGHDNKIFGFIPNIEDPIVCLQGHSGTVCCLSSSSKEDILLSSSWDCSAKIWNVFQQECVFTIYGHTQTIWAIIHIPLEYVITGSADKTIKVFSSDGEFVNTLSGHTDCVRGLSHVYESIIVSCGNDGTIRTWNVIDGSCLSMQELHPNYIYSIKSSYDKNIIALGCEDKILSLIINANQQDIVLPAQSIWAVDILPNSDIVTGSSDGYIRIFTASSSRKASLEELKIFEQQVIDPTLSAHQLASITSVKNLNKVIDEVKFDGQLKFLKVLGTIKCFKWSASRKKWLPLEDKKTTPESEAKERETKCESKDYDLIFDIDIEDNIASPLSLPYSFDDNPLIVAEKFISEHNLDSKFTNKLIRFLASSKKKDTQKCPNSYYPPKNYIFIKKFEESILKQRLSDYWEQQSMSLDDPSLDCIKSLLSSNEVLNDQSIRSGIREMIMCIDTWPESVVYPVLDVARIAILSPKVSSIMFKEGYGVTFWDVIKTYMHGSSSYKNKMLVCRILCNMFSSKEGIDFIFERKEFIFSCLPMSSFSEKHRGYEIALSSLIVNVSAEAYKRNDNIAATACLWIVQHLLMVEQDEEALFRALVAFGTLSLSIGLDVNSIRNDVYLRLKEIMKWRYRNDGIKAATCAKLIIQDCVSLVLGSDIKTDEGMEVDQ